MDDLERFLATNSLGVCSDVYALEALRTAGSLLNDLGSASPSIGDTGRVSCDLDNNCSLICVVLESSEFDGKVERIGKSYIVYLTSNMLRTFFHLSCAVWHNPNFRDKLHETLRGVTSIPAAPAGFESVYFEKRSGSAHHPEFYRSFVRCIEFFWLHEFSHIFFGHFGSNLNAALEMAEPGSEEEGTPLHSIPYHAVEIEADAWAATEPLLSAHEQVLRNAATEVELAATYVGCMLFPVAQHGLHMILESKDKARQHPPLWFRARRIHEIAVETFDIAWRKVFERDSHVPRYRSTRSRYEALFADATRALCEHLPDFTVTLDADLGLFAERFEQEARTGHDEWFAARKNFTCWPSNAAPPNR